MAPRPPDPAEEPTQTPLDAPEEEDETAALSEFSTLAARLGAAAAGSAAEQRTAEAIFERVNRLSKDAQRRLFTRPEFRELFELASDRDHPNAADDPPGTIYYRTINGAVTPWGKKPWTWHDLRDYPTETWVPERKATLIFNGLPVTVFARRRVTLPCVFYGLYMDSQRNEELAEEHAAWLMKKGDGRLTDPSIVSPDGAASRAVANHDGKLNLHVPGGGVPALAHVGDMDAEPARRAG